MTENVVYLHGEPEPVGHFLRVGNTGHRQLEELLGSGRMLLDRVVLDAASVTRQHDLVNGLVASGAELILDTNIAELSSIGRFSGAVKSAPWANPKSVLTAGDMKPTANRDIIRDIARFAVRNHFNVVQAPDPRPGGFNRQAVCRGPDFYRSATPRAGRRRRASHRNRLFPDH